MAQKTLFMETTQIDAQQTAGEVTSCLVRAGAREISTSYDEQGIVVGVRFTIEVLPGVIKLFALPARIDPIFKILNGRRAYNRAGEAGRDREQAKRVAWRQLLRWTQAQLAIIETGMIAAGEAFLPYMDDGRGVTLYEYMIESKMKALPAPEPDNLVEFKKEAANEG